jgi:uncharacterized protein DUF1549/uncharacterized protein DUF1553
MLARAAAGSLFAWLVLTPIAAAGEPSKPTPIPTAVRPGAALQSLEASPKELVLDGPRARGQFEVVGRFADGREWDFTREAKWTCTEPGFVRVDGGVILPAKDGTAKVRVEAGGQSAEVSVVVKNMAADAPVNFTTEVMPLLTKLGCNGGACHGLQHGKGGFKLSLFGFDPEADYPQIVKSAEGRRVVLADPERSILLLKPSLQMEHGGGERMKPGSWQYSLLKQWLEDGAPAPGANDPMVTRIDVFPPRRLMQPGEEQQILVRATWSNGQTEDVTRTARYDSLNDALAKVSSEGLVQTLGRGETHVMIRFGGQATVFQVTSPFKAGDATAQLERFNFIDDHLIAKWKSLGLAPSGVCSDTEFLRRIYLDTIGTLPTAEEIRAFLSDTDPQKRQKAIDRVLERPEFVDYWALKWGDLLRNNRDALQEKGMWSFHNWTRAALRDNKPVDEFVRDIITAEGSTFTDGPANFYRIGNNAADWAETTSQLFLGVRIQCAKCHHHPFEKWSQDDYYAMSAFFARMGTKNSQEFGLFGRETVVFLRPNGEQNHPKRGGVVKPRPLDGQPVDDPFDRRRKLAEWITAKENGLFARNIVNRFWGYYMGHGLVEPLDDLRATNPSTNPELLDALARDFANSNYNLKHLLRTIMNSRGYQLGSGVTAGNEADRDNTYFARHVVKRLAAEQVADALDFATGTQEKYPGLPLGTRAIQLPDTAVRSFLLDTFGRPPRQITCECERTASPNIAQALHMANGDLINAKLTRNDNRLDKLFKAKKPLSEIVEELYLVTVSRPPRPEEAKTALDWIGKAPNPRAGAEDLLWALLNSREFLFNH